MRKEPKKIIAIVGSRDISFVNFDSFIDKTKVAKVISGGAKGVDSLAEKWAKENRIPFLLFAPNEKIYKNYSRACLERDKEIVEAVDEVFAFWNGKSTGTFYTVSYAASIGRPYALHIIEDR